MATTLEELQILITSETSGLKKELAKVKRELSGTEKEVNKATSGISSTLKKLGIVLAGVFAVKKVIDFGKASVTAANEMAVHEAKLATIMRQRMQATDATIKSVKDLIAAQEAIGVVDVVAQTAAAQELSTYLESANSLKTLMPTLNDLIAQQYGLSASAEQATGMATMLGKVMDGQVGALSRYGFTFDEAQEKILKYGSETQRVALLAEIVKDSLGNMNEELGKTPQGRMKQLSYTIDAIKMSIGNGLMSAIQAVMPYLNAMANTLLKAAQYFQMLMSAIFGTAQMSTAAAGAAISVADAQTEAGDAAEKAGKKASRAVQGFDEINSLPDKSDSNAGGSSESGSMLPDLQMPKIDTETIPDQIKAMVDKVKGFVEGINFQPLVESFEKLKTAIMPLTETLFSGLRWLWDNVLVPFGTWSIQSLIPAFLDLISGALTVLNPLLTAFQPIAQYLWDNFLQPIAAWTGGTIVSVLTSLGQALTEIGNWMSKHQTTVTTLTAAVGVFFAAWKTVELLAFIQMSGGVASAFGKITTAIWAATGAKIVNAAETIYLTGLYAKDLVVSAASAAASLAKKTAAWIASTAAIVANKVALLASNVVMAGEFLANMAASAVALGTNAVSWAASTAAMIANKIAMVASTVAQGLLTVAMIAWNVAVGIGTAVTTAFNVALGILTSPITLVIAGIALLVTGIILLVQNWDKVSEVAANVWDGIKKVWTSASGWMYDTVIKPIANMYTGLWNGIIEGMNFMIRSLNKLKFDIPDWVPFMGGESFGLNIPEIPKIPKLAKGGITNGEMLATIGDNPGGKEVVSPLGDLLGMIQSVVAASMSANQQMSVNSNQQLPDIVLQIDGQAFARVTNPYSAREGARIGGSMITAF